MALNYGMPIESVSKILGHTNITTTQIYGKGGFSFRCRSHLKRKAGTSHPARTDNREL